VRIRWRFTSDGGAEFSGFWLDEVRITGEGGVVDSIFANGFEVAPPIFGRGSGGVINGGDYICH